ncbi:MAG: hypothetical protein ACJAZW_001386 [Maritalea sp.]|jgi:hypothetical protein
MACCITAAIFLHCTTFIFQQTEVTVIGKLKELPFICALGETNAD